MIKKILTLVVIFSFVFTNISLAECANQKNGLKQDSDFKKSRVNWTVLYYICGDDEVIDSYVDPLIENISKIGSNNDLNIVTLTDRLGYGNSKICYIKENGSELKLNNVLNWPEEVDMSKSETLEIFCKKIIDFFPSEHYALITYADGGTGWQKYILNDEEGKGYLTNPEFAGCLKKITNNGENKLDILHTSCCMSNIEVAYEFAPYVKYLVTTQEHISHEYWVRRFYQSVSDLKNNTSMDPVEFSKRAAIRHKPHSYQMHESYGLKISFITKIFNQLPFPMLHTVQMHSSVSVVNLSRIQNLKNDIQNLTELLLLYSEDENFINAIKEERKHTREYGKGQPRYMVHPIIYAKFPIEILSYSCRIDFYQLVELIKRNIDNFMIQDCCESVLNSINDSIVIIKKVENDPSHGLNIYFPEKGFDYNKDIEGGKISCIYEELKFSKESSWDEYLKTYLKI